MRSDLNHSFIWRVPALGGVEAFKASFARFSYARHSHDSYAFGTIDAGAMGFWHGGAVHTAPAGSLIAINPGEVHDGQSEACRYRMLYVERATVDEIFSVDAPGILRIPGLRGPVIRDALLAESMRRFHETLDAAHRDSTVLLEQQSRLIQVLYALFARHGVPPLDAVPGTVEKRCVMLAKGYMAEHLADHVRLADLAKEVGFSPYYFLRTFKRSTGLSPHAYLNQLRLERARALLRQGQPAAQVAAAVGFVDQSHLTRRFRAAFGVTPGQYAAA